MYVISLLQIISQPSLGGMSAMQKVTGFVQDSSKFIHYHWWQQVYYLDPDVPFPSESREKIGRWCGVADDTGDILTYKVLTNDTQQLINVSDIRPCSGRPNLRADFGNSSSSSLGENTGISLDPGEPENETKAHNLTMGDPRDVVIDFVSKIIKY